MAAIHVAGRPFCGDPVRFLLAVRKDARPYGKAGTFCIKSLGWTAGKIQFFPFILLHAHDAVPGIVHTRNTGLNESKA